MSSSKSFSIRFNEREQRELEELTGLLGISDSHGGFASAIKLSVKVCVTTLKNQVRLIKNVIQPLTPNEIELWLSSIKQVELSRRKQERIEKQENKA